MSETNKPLILVTNDDGINAPGIRALVNSLEADFDLCVVAPEVEKSGVGMSITFRTPVTYERLPWTRIGAGNNSPHHEAYSIAGTPADCIRLAMSIILKRPPVLVVSGINRGSNSGRTVLYSGTVAGVIEAALRGLPGIAFSCDNFLTPDYHTAASYIPKIVEYALKYPASSGTFLNVTFPDQKVIRGIKLSRQGASYPVESPEERLHPDGAPYYWMGGKWADLEEHPESDILFVKEGYISVTPISIGEMTDHSFLLARKEGFESFFSSPTDKALVP